MEAKLYDELHRVEQTHWWFRARRHIVWSLVRRYVDGGTDRRLRICELGCGTGGNLTAIAEDHDVVGVECALEALMIAEQSLGNRVRFGRLPNEVDLPTSSFDVVLLPDVLEHIENDAAAARMALGLVRPGGIVVATVPAYQWLFSPRDVHHHHFRRYARKQFGRLWATEGVQVEMLGHYNSVLFPVAAAVRLFSKFSTSNEPEDLTLPPRLLNECLARLMQSEAHLLGRLPLPFGLSLIAVVRRCSTTSASKVGLAA